MITWQLKTFSGTYSFGMWTWRVSNFCQVNDKKLSRKILNFVHNTITRKKKWSPQSLKTNTYFSTIIDWGEKSLRINNMASKLDLRVVSSPKSLQIQCRHMLIVSTVCRATITPQKVYIRTDRKFRVNSKAFRWKLLTPHGWKPRAHKVR